MCTKILLLRENKVSISDMNKYFWQGRTNIFAREKQVTLQCVQKYCYWERTRYQCPIWTSIFGKREQIFSQERNKSLCNVYKNIVVEWETKYQCSSIWTSIIAKREKNIFTKEKKVTLLCKQKYCYWAWKVSMLCMNKYFWHGWNKYLCYVWTSIFAMYAKRDLLIERNFIMIIWD